MWINIYNKGISNIGGFQGLFLIKWGEGYSLTFVVENIESLYTQHEALNSYIHLKFTY